jgi:N-acetylglucosaminyldiphosphoundecaprenol N-acetyl-beta-D-mannosaminyltransferase
VVRASLPKLIRATLRHPRRGPADAAVDLAIPPLGLLALLAVGGSIVSAAAALVGLAAWWAVIPWLGSVLALALFVLVGLRAARAPAATYRALLRAPWFLITRLTGLVGVLRRSRNTDWVRTERLVDTTGAAERVLIDGVPIDWVDTDTAIERLVTAAHTDGFMQVSTVNLDFLVNARRSPDIRAILDGNGLNLADGAPVVWLGRLRGVRGPERVAGSDLVPRLMKVAADQGLGVFFLGGEHGASEEAARCLRVSYPDLQVEVYEPPRGGLDSLSDPEIFRRIDASGARLLLVAFGHPKQERWIRQHRDQLRMVAVGVGCSLDLIAGRSKRAPAWMQRVGLEWCYRLFREPGRLLRRYATDGLWFLGVLLPSTMRDRIKRRPLVHLPAASPVTAVEPSDAWSDPPAATELSQTA